MLSHRQIIQKNTESKVQLGFGTNSPKCTTRPIASTPICPRAPKPWLQAVTQHKKWLSPGGGVGLYRFCVPSHSKCCIQHLPYGKQALHSLLSSVLKMCLKLPPQRHSLMRKKHWVTGFLPKKLNYCCVKSKCEMRRSIQPAAYTQALFTLLRILLHNSHLYL